MTKINISSRYQILKFIFIFILILKILESFVLMGHGDALSYHLVLGRYILEYGFLYPHENFFLTAQAGLFDYFYTIPQWIFGSGVLAQIVSQFMHFSTSILLAIALIKIVFNTSDGRLLYFIGGLSFLTFNRSPDFFIYAKNDGVLALTFLFGTLFVFEYLPRNKFAALYRRKPFFTGMILGLLPVIKMNGLIYSFVLFVSYCFLERKKISNILKSLLPAIVVSLIIFIRNWIIVKDPVFPAIIELFPTDMTREMISFHNSMLNSKSDWIGVLRNYLIAFSPKYLCLLLPPLFILNIKSGRSRLNGLVLMVLGFTTIYCMRNPGYAAERFYFGCNFVVIFYLLQSLKEYGIDRIKPIQLVLIVMLLFADSKIDKIGIRTVKYYKDVFQLGLSKELREKYIPYTTVWQYVEEGARVATDHAYMQYYAPKGVRLYQAGNAKEANFFLNCKDFQLNPSDFFDYLLLSKSNLECVGKSFVLVNTPNNKSGYQLYKKVAF